MAVLEHVRLVRGGIKADSTSPSVNPLALRREDRVGADVEELSNVLV